MYTRPLFKASDEELINKFHKVNNFDTLADLLEFNVYGLKRIFDEIKNQNRHYKEFFINKKSGEKRQILTPDYKLKLIQRRLAHIFSLIYIGRNSVHGFRRGKSIITNSEKHIHRKALLNLDLKDFFPTIHFGRVRGILQTRPYSLPKTGATLIAGFCCYKGKLPQGAPTSPIISNMICSRLDHELQQFAYEEHCVYSRYADDIVFSTTNRNGFSQNMVEGGTSEWIVGPKLGSIIVSNDFKVNPKKTRVRFYTERQEVTGLVVNEFPNIKREFVKEVRMMLHIWRKFGIVDASKKYANNYCADFYDSLKGKINFIKLVKTKGDNTYNVLAEKFNTLDQKPIFEIVPRKNWPDGEHFKEGDIYKGRNFLKTIFNNTEREVFIIDNYLEDSIVSLLESLFLKNKLIKINLLITKENKIKYKNCVEELKKLIRIHPEIQLKCRESRKDGKKHFSSHDRYIIIDETEIYDSGNSLGQLGEASSSISRMRGQTEKKEALIDLKSHFDKAQDINLL